MTAFAKVTSFVAPILDPDSVLNEKQIRAMARLEQPSDDELNKLR